MKQLALSRAGRAFVLGVVAVGTGLILASVVQLVLEATSPYWFVLAVLTLFTAPLSLRIPSVRATVTVRPAIVGSWAECSSQVFFKPGLAETTRSNTTSMQG